MSMSDPQKVRGFFPPDHVRLAADDAALQADARRTEALSQEEFQRLVDELLAEQPGLCLASAEWVYFRSPDWTWQQMCGRAGWMLWDPSTGEQFAFRMTVMN